MEVSGQLHAPDALPPGKEPLVPIGQEDGWTPVLDAVVKRKIPIHCWESNPRTPIVQHVAQEGTIHATENCCMSESKESSNVTK
jgi:hypothetical protein